MNASVPTGRCGPCCSTAATGSTATVLAMSAAAKSRHDNSAQNVVGGIPRPPVRRRRVTPFSPQAKEKGRRGGVREPTKRPTPCRSRRQAGLWLQRLVEQPRQRLGLARETGADPQRLQLFQRRADALAVSDAARDDVGAG